ncbi:kelch repeat protein [Dictyocaulus viviparus]|uniref:Kelch repeat protein n=1 Tax=Dictyocaulus viviparus TaxID=29172 RepID=A0A0D8Y310_DICVI|nr:kelch repeat protein [Dictyocaulus viviparus]
MDGWCVESDSSTCHTTQSSESCRAVHHFINDRLSGDFFLCLTSLWRHGDLCDVILEASGHSGGTESESASPTIITAHKVVLAASCPYFRAMFTSNMVESNKGRIVIMDIDGPTLALLVEYMYSGRLDICETNVQCLLSTASILQLTCVRDACSRFLLEQLDITNCLGIASFAQTHNCTQLAHAAQMFTHQHFRLLIESEELLSMDEESFIQLISDDRLTTEGEEAVFEAVINWVKYEPSRKASLPNVMKAVRLPLISQEFLLDRAYQEPLIQESSPCIAMLCSVYHHILKKEITPGLFANWIRPRQPIPMSQLLMIVGGQAPKAISNVDTFDPDSQRWNSLAPLQQRRCRCGVVRAGDLIYAIGGFNGSARIRSVEIYDPHRDLWLNGPFMEARRSTLGVAVLNGSIIAVGGFDGSTGLCSAEMLDPRQVGGFDGSTGLCSAEMLDPRQDHWVALPSMTTRRSSVGVAAMSDIVYAVGGYDGQSRQCLNSVELYDIRANRWRMGEPLLEVRSGAGVAVYRDRLIAAGGHNGPVVRATVEALSEGNWTYQPEMSICRRNAGIIVANGFVFALGGDDGTSNLSSVECLEIDGIDHRWNMLQARFGTNYHLVNIWSNSLQTSVISM